MSRSVSVPEVSRIVVVSNGDAIDVAVVALVQQCGYRAEIVPVLELAERAPLVVLVRDEVALARAAHRLPGSAVTFVVMRSVPGAVKRVGGRRVVWSRGPDVAADLSRELHRRVDPAQPA